MYKFSLFCAIAYCFGFAACTSSTAGDTEHMSGMNKAMVSHNRLDCKSVGGIALDKGYIHLRNAIGSENIKEDFVMENGVATGLKTILWKQSNKEVEVKWDGSDPAKMRVKSLLISNPESYWVVAKGVKVGMTLKELVKRNRSEISFQKMNKDTGGEIVSFSNGRLPRENACMGGVLAFNGSGTALPAADVLNSGDKGIDKEEIYLKYITLTNPAE